MMAVAASALANNPVVWKVAYSADKKVPGKGAIHVRADVADPFHIYGERETPTGPSPTTVKLKLTAPKEMKAVVASVGVPQPVIKFDSAFDQNVEVYDPETGWTFNIEMNGTKFLDMKVELTVGYQACDGEKCLRPMTEIILFTMKWDKKKNTYTLVPAKKPKTASGKG
jgi:hypothetical protein